MKQEELNELRELIADYVDRYPHKNKTDLAQLILDENDDIPLSHRSIRRYVSLAKKEAALREETLAEDFFDAATELGDGLRPTTEGSVKLGPVSSDYVRVDIGDDGMKKDEEETQEAEMSYSSNDADPFTNGAEVLLDYRGEQFYVPLRTIDRVFCAYSRKGLNLTGPIVRTLLDLDIKTFSAILSRMDLNKESKPYSETAIAIMDDDTLQEYLSENTSYVLDLLYKHDGTVTTELVRAYKSELVKLKNQDLYLKSLLAQIKNELPKIKTAPIKAIDPEFKDIITHLIIPDMHIGLNQENYNNEIVREKLQEVIGYIDPRFPVHVTFMGDIIHSVSGMNHKDSWKNMDPSQTGANAIIKPYEILLDFILGIPSVIRVNIVGGNHDRLQSDKSYENTAEGAKLIAYMLDYSLEGIQVVFSSSYIADDDDPGLCMIYLHGDNPIDKESVQTLSWNFGNPDKFNYVFTGHMHSRKMEPKNDGLKYRKEQLPAFCPSDNYAKTLTAGSMPGFKIVTISNGVPVSVDIALKYD